MSEQEPKMVEQIREAIRVSGLTLVQIEEQTGIDHGRLSRFVRGERTLTLPAAARICELLGGRLVFGYNGPTPTPSATGQSGGEAPPKRKRKGKGD